MGTIVAIGGGKETLEIDRFIVSLSEKEKPKVLIIPTASGESQGYIGLLSKIYNRRLKCKISTLKLLTRQTSDETIREKILSADIIYVGAGDTLKMLQIWREYGVDRYLSQAHEKGIIISGLSAGAICWFQYGYSDSELVVGGEYKKINGLGFLPFMMCPHYDERDEFDDFMRTQTSPAIALENNCALVIRDSLYKVVKGITSARAFFIKSENGKVLKRELDSDEYRPTEELLA